MALLHRIIFGVVMGLVMIPAKHGDPGVVRETFCVRGEIQWV